MAGGCRKAAQYVEACTDLPSYPSATLQRSFLGRRLSGCTQVTKMQGTQVQSGRAASTGMGDLPNGTNADLLCSD